MSRRQPPIVCSRSSWAARGPRVALVAAAFTLSSRAVGADPAPPELERPQAAALSEALFKRGKALMAEGRLPEACATFAESVRLDPGGGALLTLALCHEAEGKIATAWTEFMAALAMARRDRREDREAIARQHLEELEPRLPRLSVRVPDEVARTPGIVVRVDGRALGRPAWGVAAPVDPGAHEVVAEAPGRQPFRVAVSVGPAASRVVVVSGLRPLAAPPRGTSPRRIAAYAAGGTGVALLGVSTYLGVRAITKAAAADERCATSACRDREAVRLNDDAKTSADFATAGFVVGGAALATAAVLWLWPADARARGGQAIRVSPTAGPRAGGALVETAW
jgi:hypothetical protein